MPRKKADFHRCYGIDPWSLRDLWTNLFPKSKAEEPKDRSMGEQSVLDQIREAKSRKAAEEIASHAHDASSGTRAKWARAIALKEI